MKILFLEHVTAKRIGGLDHCCQRISETAVKFQVSIRRSARDIPSVDTPFDLIHRHGMWNVRYIGQEAISGKPVVYSPHGMLEPWSLNQKKLRKKLLWHMVEKPLLQRAAALHATSIPEAKQMRRLGLKPPIAVVPLGTDLPESFRVSLRDKCRTGRDSRTVIFLSRIHPKKGLITLIHAWKKIAKSGWKLRIVGPDEAGHRADVEKCILDNGLSAEIEIGDPLEGVGKWQALCDAELMVLPTHSENFGLVIAESLACRTPVITTIGTPWKILNERRCGWWIENSTQELANSLESAMNLTDAERAEMGARGRQLIEEDFTWDCVAEQFSILYRWCIDSKNGRVSPSPDWFLNH